MFSTGCNNIPHSAGLASPVVAQCAFCFIHDEKALLALIHLGVQNNTQVLFSSASIQPVGSHPELMHELFCPRGRTVDSLLNFLMLIFSRL